MRLAIIYWKMIHSVGGIATHLNSLKDAAKREGDSCDILMSDAAKTRHPQLFSERQWMRGGDTNIWVDGLAPHHPNNIQETLNFLKKNYDAILFSKLVPHKITAYPDPLFLPIFDLNMPKIALVPDGYWDMYEHWGKLVLNKVNWIFCPVKSYTLPIKKLGYKRISTSYQPFIPLRGKWEKRSKDPLIVWPNQWKDIKGIKPFMEQIPKLSKHVEVELYSCGIRYYQLRKEELWQKAVGKDLFKGHNGKGRSTYFGNVDLPEISKAMQRAWFTVNLQGMKSRKETYKKGSYNYTEVEALFYGACPILHSSTSQTHLPDDLYLQVDSAEEIPNKVHQAIKSGFAIDSGRQQSAKEFVIKHHLASNLYREMKGKLT